jgi:ribonuclease VapC
MTEQGVSVLDASALLAYLHDEPGAAPVEEALAAGAVMGSANWAETLSKLADRTGEDVDSILRRLQGQGLTEGLLTVLPLTLEDAITIARLRPETRPLGLSLGDRACLALGLRLGLPVLTADRRWHGLSLGIPLRVIR